MSNLEFIWAVCQNLMPIPLIVLAIMIILFINHNNNSTKGG